MWNSVVWSVALSSDSVWFASCGVLLMLFVLLLILVFYNICVYTQYFSYDLTLLMFLCYIMILVVLLFSRIYWTCSVYFHTYYGIYLPNYKYVLFGKLWNLTCSKCSWRNSCFLILTIRIAVMIFKPNSSMK